MIERWKDKIAEVPEQAPIDPTWCGRCGGTDAAVMMKTNAAELGHANHGLLCGSCWSSWMKGKRWTRPNTQLPHWKERPSDNKKLDV